MKALAILKFNSEYFNHGVAPISYNWNTTSSHILSLDQPTKEDHGPSSLIMTSKKIRDNYLNDDYAQFYSNFNSSSIYMKAGEHGEAPLTVHVALEYPEEYKYKQNWFTTTATVKVVDKL